MIRPCVPSHIAYVCELQAVEDDCLTGGENDRSDLVSHGQYARCYGGAATIRLKRNDNESRNRKVLHRNREEPISLPASTWSGASVDIMVSISKLS